MSVRTMARVWEFSQHGGTHLLMLLAIADFADDAGNAYPAVATLAAKCRMKPRNAQVLLSALRESGELQVLQNEGPKGANRYRIVLNQGAQSITGVQILAGVQRIAPRGVKACAKPLQGIASEPSMNHQEPPVMVSQRTGKQPSSLKAENNSRFEIFWKAYPRKVCKKDAKKAFEKINPDESLLQTMLKAVRQQSNTPGWTKDDGKYIPHPTTWLNGARWEDNDTAVSSGADDWMKTAI